MNMTASEFEPFQHVYRLPDVVRSTTDGSGQEEVKFTDFENFFNIYQDKEAYFRYNLNSTLYIDVPKSRLKSFVCQHDMHWPTISFSIYGTVRLAWILMKVNNITPDIAFNIIPPGSAILYLDRSDITTVIDGFGN